MPSVTRRVPAERRDRLSPGCRTVDRCQPLSTYCRPPVESTVRQLLSTPVDPVNHCQPGTRLTQLSTLSTPCRTAQLLGICCARYYHRLDHAYSSTIAQKMFRSQFPTNFPPDQASYLLITTSTCCPRQQVDRLTGSTVG